MAHMKDDMWQVHKAAYAPTIDGEMDDIYFAASTQRIVIVDNADAAPPDSYLDLFATGRLLWDDTNLYIFIKVVDDEVSSSSANSYENDSAEIYFDAGDDKADTYGEDDVQTRIEYQDGDDETLYDSCPEGTEGATADWENPDGDAFGYTIEVAYPLAGLSIDAEEGTIFGFEIQVNDRDNEARENMYRFWGNDNMAWQQPSLFGTAELIGYVADDVMGIPMATSAPEIDGVLEDAWIDQSVSIDMGTYVFTNADAVDGSFTEIEEWEDAQMDFRAMWDADALYLWVAVIDDEISISGGNSYENDGIEVCVDGDNAKTEGSYDADDIQYRWVWSLGNDAGAPASVVAWGELDELDGYTAEIMIPAADLTFTPELDAEIGFEIQINERDNELRENMMRWWGSDNMTWTDASRMGTAVLTEPLIVGVEDVIAAKDYQLAQNFPNPFNPSTTIQYNLAQRGAVKLTVFDVLGNEVATLVNDVQQSGPNTVTFDGSDLSSGVYFYTLETTTEIITKKMMLMK